MSIPVAISYKKQNEQKTAETKALLDTGAGGKFIDQSYVRAQGLQTENLEFSIEVYNVDGTPNK
jgi:predicted aspartyl protease